MRRFEIQGHQLRCALRQDLGSVAGPRSQIEDAKTFDHRARDDVAMDVFVGEVGAISKRIEALRLAFGGSVRVGRGVGTGIPGAVGICPLVYRPQDRIRLSSASWRACARRSRRASIHSRYTSRPYRSRARGAPTARSSDAMRRAIPASRPSPRSPSSPSSSRSRSGPTNHSWMGRTKPCFRRPRISRGSQEETASRRTRFDPEASSFHSAGMANAYSASFGSRNGARPPSIGWVFP